MPGRVVVPVSGLEGGWDGQYSGRPATGLIRPVDASIREEGERRDGAESASSGAVSPPRRITRKVCGEGLRIESCGGTAGGKRGLLAAEAER